MSGNIRGSTRDQSCVPSSSSAVRDFECLAIDTTNAFIQGQLVEEVFGKQPPGFNDQSGVSVSIEHELERLEASPACAESDIGGVFDFIGLRQK
jgi:hypothetical protein